MMGVWCVCGTEASTCVGRTTSFENVTLPLRWTDLYTRQRHTVKLLDDRTSKWCNDLGRARRPVARIMVQFYAANGPVKRATRYPPDPLSQP